MGIKKFILGAASTIIAGMVCVCGAYPAAEFYAVSGETSIGGEQFTAVERTDAEDSRYTIDENGVLTDYWGGETTIVIPDGVTAIGSSAFKGNIGLTHLIIGSSVQSIGFGAFDSCPSLESVDMSGSSITLIETRAFAECKKLSSVKLPKTLKSLNQRAFYNCDNLASIEIPASLETCFVDAASLGKGPFEACSSLKTVTFGEGATKVAKNLFSECDGLEQITLPDTITSIDQSAFENCENLKKVNFSKSLQTIGHSAFRGTGLLSVKLYDSVTSIDGYAFADCSKLSSLTLSKSLKEMDNKVFTGCESLTSVEIPASLEKCWLGSGPFEGCSNLKTVTFEKGTTRVAPCLFYKCEGLEEITLPDSIISVDDRAFSECVNLKKVTWSKNLEKIDNAAFSGTKLSSVKLPDSVAYIGNNAFQDCSELSSVTLPKSLKEFGGVAFNNCTGLKSVEIPANLEKCRLGSGVFEKCSNLKKVTFEKGTTRVAPCLFYRCEGLEMIVLPNTIISINDRAFAECENLTAIVIPKSVTTISTKFANPDKLTIYGTSGSYAETYANENNINFVKLDLYSLTHLVSGISVTPVDDGLIPGTELDVEPVDVDSEMASKVDGADTAYDITMRRGGIEVQPSGKIKITIPVPDKLIGKFIKAYRQEEDGTYTLISVVYDSKNNTISFETTHLSVYVIAGSDTDPGDINKDGYFDIDDVIDLARSILTTTDPAKNPYLPEGDRDKSGKIDIDDVILLARELIM